MARSGRARQTEAVGESGVIAVGVNGSELRVDGAGEGQLELTEQQVGRVGGERGATTVTLGYYW
jgi:hypothetical protein